MRHFRMAFRWVLCILILAVLLLPLIEMQSRWSEDKRIEERSDAIHRPEQLGRFLDRQWQIFLEQYFARNIGLRSDLVALFNEAKLRLFPQRPSITYVQSSQLGFYPVYTIERFNQDFIYRDRIRKYYGRAAERLRKLQDYLHQFGVTFVVVPAPPKVRVYPEFVERYLVASADEMMKQAVSYADVLSKHGVNVVNAERIMRERKTSSRWPFFSTTGYHWNYVAGCQIADEILQLAEKVSKKPFFAIGCSEISEQKSHGRDTDIALILNILSIDRIIGNSPFPNIRPDQSVGSQKRKIIIVGDSYANQLIYAFVHALPDANWMPDWLEFWNWNQNETRYTSSDRTVTSPKPLEQGAILPKIMSADLVILELSDDVIYRTDSGNLKYVIHQTTIGNLEYTFTTAILNKLANGVSRN